MLDIDCDIEYGRHQLCQLNGTNKSHLEREIQIDTVSLGEEAQHT